MEAVDAEPGPWTTEDYTRCAYLLGLLASRRTPDRPAGRSPLPAGFAVEKLVSSRDTLVEAMLADDEQWRPPSAPGSPTPAYGATCSRPCAPPRR